MNKKIMVAVEVILVVGILAYLFFSLSPKQIYPIQGAVVSDPDFSFEIENGDEVIISSSSEFTNPITLKEGSSIILPPGTYYWKVKGLFGDSEIRIFTIESNVGLNLKERHESFELENAGNVELEITKEDPESGESEEFDLEVNEIIEFDKDDSRYEGGQK